MKSQINQFHTSLNWCKVVNWLKCMYLYTTSAVYEIS